MTCPIEGCIRGEGINWGSGPTLCVPHRAEWAADHEQEISTEEWERWANEWAYDDGEPEERPAPPRGMEEVECQKCGPLYIAIGSSNHKCGREKLAPKTKSHTRSTWPEMFKTARRPSRAQLEVHNARMLVGWKADREKSEQERIERYRDQKQYEPGFGQRRWGPNR